MLLSSLLYCFCMCGIIKPSPPAGTALVEGGSPQGNGTELRKVLNFDPLMLQFLSSLHTQPQDSTPEHK